MVRDKKNKIAEEQRMILEVESQKFLKFFFFFIMIHFDSLPSHLAAFLFFSLKHFEHCFFS